MPMEKFDFFVEKETFFFIDSRKNIKPGYIKNVKTEHIKFIYI